MDDLRRKIQRNEQRLAQNEIPVLVSSEQVRRLPPCSSSAAPPPPRCNQPPPPQPTLMTVLEQALGFGKCKPHKTTGVGSV